MTTLILMAFRARALVVILLSLGLMTVCSQARFHFHHHRNKKHRHSHSHPGSQISLPPSPPPEASPPPDYDDDHVFDVRAFGAVGDGIADDTEAFKAAWDAACTSSTQLADLSSAIVMLPSGYSFMIQSTIFTGPCQTAIVVQVDGVLMPPDGPDNWPSNLSRRQWLVFYRVDGMSLQGGGLIDGRGEEWWNLPCKPHKVRA